MCLEFDCFVGETEYIKPVNAVECLYLFFRCCTDPRHWNLPLTMMAILVQRASHSSILSKVLKRLTYVTDSLKGNCSSWDLQKYFLVYISSYLCEVRTTALPSLVTLRMQFHRNLLAFGSMPVVGSSYKELKKSRIR